MTSDEVERKAFLEGVQRLLNRPGMTIDQVRQAIAAQTPQAPYFTLADADRFVMEVKSELARGDQWDAAIHLHNLNLKIIECLAAAQTPSQMWWFKTLAQKSMEADRLIEKYGEDEDDARRSKRDTQGSGSQTGAIDPASP